MAHDISVIGPLNIDLLIVGEGPARFEEISTWDGPADMEMTAAGSVGYNVSDLAKLGLDVAVSSCVSDDALGAFIIESLRRDGVDTSRVRRIADSKAGIGVYMLLFGSRKRPLVYRMPTHPAWPQDYDGDEIIYLLNAKALHCGGYLHFKDVWHGPTVEIFKKAKGKRLITSLDSQFPLFAMDPPWLDAMADIMPFVDIFFCDETEARKITGKQDLNDCAQELLGSGARMIVIKQGAEGSSIFWEKNQYHQKAIIQGELVDSIGAGDAFDACFLYGTLQEWPIEKRALFASTAAGYTVTDVGGTKSFPMLAEIEKSMASSK
jgi:sugar/nucleoside kinase (ribokinase family)